MDENEDVQLFYYFVKSKRNPSKDPLIIWLSGGPGCSSFFALSYEIGPLNFEKVDYNGTLLLGSLIDNVYVLALIDEMLAENPARARLFHDKSVESAAYEPFLRFLWKGSWFIQEKSCNILTLIIRTSALEYEDFNSAKSRLLERAEKFGMNYVV